MGEFAPKERYSMDDLLALVERLRDPVRGCPWDKVQTHASIRKNMIEEAYEAADAIDLADDHLLCEELGDVLLQVALHVRMAEEAGAFTFEDVCTGICRKLVYRHPHLFADAQASDAGQVLDAWEKLKRAEKHREGLAADLADVPAAMPALMRAQKLQKRAAAHGVQELDASGARAKLEEAAARLAGATADEAEAALGETLFWAAALGRAQGADAEQALAQANAAFTREAAAHEG